MAASVQNGVLSLSPTTLKIIKNFRRFTKDGVAFAAGTTQRILLQSKSVFAEAELPDAFPQDLAVYDMDLLLSTLSLFDAPKIEFTPKKMVISTDAPGAKLSVMMNYSDPSLIDADLTPKRTLSSDNPALTFTMSQYTLNTLKKTAGMLNLTHLYVSTKDDGILFSADDPKIPNSNGFTLQVPDSDVTVNDNTYERSMRFQVEHFGFLLDGDYTVSMAGWKYAAFKNTNLPINYFIAEDKGEPA